MFRLVAAGVAALSLGLMVGVAYLGVTGGPPPEPPEMASVAIARPSDPPIANPKPAPATSTQTAAEPHPVVATPSAPVPASAPPVPAAASKPALPAPASPTRAAPARTAPPALVRKKRHVDEDDDDC